MDLHATLQEVFGFDVFRTGQAQTVGQLLAGHSSLAIFPTGSGKSLCYQFTATQLPHLTLVVSPLLALIKDQLQFLHSKGIHAASIDSTLSTDESREVMADVKSGKTKILMVSVERFKNERFRRFIQSIPISMLVVDEAHCISEWGHNFRPDYLKLPTYCKELNISLVLLLTATATRQVKQDMASKFGIAAQHIVQTGFYRSNLDLSVEPLKTKDKGQRLYDYLSKTAGSAIVYVTLQQTAEQVANLLKRRGLLAQAYHAGLENEQRQQIQLDFMSGKTQIIVATIAFGMGIDKSDIRYVVHYDLPKSIENYSQEIGRAGRDAQPSNCIVLANLDSLNTLENFVYGDTPELAGVEKVLATIVAETNAGQWEAQILALSNETNVRQLPLKTLLVQLELRGIVQPSHAYFAEYKYKFLVPKEQVLERFQGERQSFLAQVFELSQLKKIWAEPDFDATYQQTGSERHRVIAALEYLSENQLIELQSKRMTEVFKVQADAIDLPILAVELHQYFAEKEQKEIKRIAMLIRFLESKNCLSYGLAKYFDDQQAPQQCGHCSVCRGQVASLNDLNSNENSRDSSENNESTAWPTDVQILDDLAGLKRHLADKGMQDSSLESCTRFLAGISVPMFSRYRVRQLPGFASCSQQRYSEIKTKLEIIGAF